MTSVAATFQRPCIHQLFEAQVERTPDAIAMVFEDQQLTYRELNGRANRLAHSLRKLNVGPEVPVGVCLERSMEVCHQLARHPEGGGRLPAVGSGVPKATNRLHVGRFEGPRAANAKALDSRIAGTSRASGLFGFQWGSDRPGKCGKSDKLMPA